MNCIRHGIALTTLAAFGFAANTAAQLLNPEIEEDRWYNVELIIFSRTAAAAANSESWEPFPTLEYPDSYRFLGYPESDSAQGKTPIVPDEPDAAALTNSDSSDQILDPNQVSPIKPRLRPTPFVRLGQDQWEFAQRARRMAQSGRYDILFHERWNQPFVSRQLTRPIILDQSGYTQDWPKLQGSITLYLSRYLHLETNFWLNTMGSYLPGDWQMPAAPLGPSPYPVAKEDEESDSVVPQEHTQSVTERASDSEPTPGFSFESEATIDAGPQYPWRHAVALKQTRKMRSKEVHYLDHPMMGVIVLVTPISSEELDAMAIEEYGLDPNQPL